MIKKIVGVMIIGSMVILTGCNSEKTKTCTRDVNHVKSEMKFTYEDKKVIKSDDTITMDIEKSGMSKKTIEDGAKTFEKIYKDVKGVTFTYKIEKNTYTRNVVVDYEKASFEKLQEIELLVKKDDKIDYISIDDSIKGLEELGMTCK